MISPIGELNKSLEINETERGEAINFFKPPLSSSEACRVVRTKSKDFFLRLFTKVFLEFYFFFRWMWLNNILYAYWYSEQLLLDHI